MKFKHIEWDGSAEILIKRDGAIVAVLCTNGKVTGGVNCKTKTTNHIHPVTNTQRTRIEIEV